MDVQAISDAVRSFSQEGARFAYLAALVAGLWLSLSGLMKLVKKGMDRADDPGHSWAAVLGRMLIGSCLVTMASKLEMVIATNGDMSQMRSVLSYTAGTAGASGNATMQAIWAAITTFCVFMGTVGFMRGLLKFDRACQGANDSGDAFWSGTWHCIGGAIAIVLFR